MATFRCMASCDAACEAICQKTAYPGLRAELAAANERADKAEAESARLRTAEFGNITDAMVQRAWETFGCERAPYTARINNFTHEQIYNGEWRAANLQADAMNDNLMRRTIAAALHGGNAPGATGDATAPSATETGAQEEADHPLDEAATRPGCGPEETP